MREVIKSSKKIRRNKTANTIILLLCGFFALFLVAGHISRSERFLIKEVEITGNNTINKKEIFESVKNYLSGNYFYIFPKTNFLLYPKSDIENGLSKRFIKINEVIAFNEDISKLKITIKERQPKFLWCPISNAECCYLDSGGMAYERAPELSSDIFFKIRGGLSDKGKIDGYIGKKIIETNKLTEFIKFKDEVSGMVKRDLDPKWSVDSLEIVGGDDYLVNFSDMNDASWVIKFVGKEGDTESTSSVKAESILNTKQDTAIDLESSLVNASRNLDAVLVSPVFKNELKNSAGGLEYIDLRFGKKIFYKFRDK